MEILVNGEEQKVNIFIHQLQNENPTASKIKYFKVNNIPDQQFAKFTIKKSTQQLGTTLISPDLAVCEDCVREMFDEKDKRHLYPFINCTNCGPRFSIIENTPYDRPATTMKDFLMCDYCKDEYKNPLNRRFHAQPIACPECGPAYSLMTNKMKEITTNNPIAETIKLLKMEKLLQ